MFKDIQAQIVVFTDIRYLEYRYAVLLGGMHVDSFVYVSVLKVI
jgi:hypothetical protein